MAELDSHLTSLHFAPGKKAHATWLTLRVACLLPRSKHLRPLPYPLGAAAVVRRRNTLGSSLGNPIGRLLSFKTYMVGVKLRVALAPAIHVTLYRPDQVTPPSVFRARHAGPGTRHDPKRSGTFRARSETFRARSGTFRARSETPAGLSELLRYSNLDSPVPLGSLTHAN